MWKSESLKKYRQDARNRVERFKQELRQRRGIPNLPSKGPSWQKSHQSIFGTRADATPVVVPPEDRNRHMMIVGASGKGKSYFMQSLIQQDIENGEGLCVVDPHGELYRNLVNFCATKGLRKKVVLFNPSDFGSYVVGFNPLAKQHHTEDISVKADRFIDAVKRVMLQDGQTQPQLESTLRNCLIPLIKSESTLLEIESFFDFQNPHRILHLAAQAQDASVFTFWENYTKMPVRDKVAVIGSTQRRIEKFLFNQAVRISLGQTQRNLKLSDIIENRKILLVNLGIEGGLISRENSHLLGVMLVNSLLSYGFCRNLETAKHRPFYIYLDEFQNFVTSDIHEILTGGRKFGLSLILANQEISQIDDQAIRDAALAARIQVVFGGMSEASAEILSQNLGSHLDLKSIKHIEERTFFEPVLEKRITRNLSSTSSSGSSSGTSTSANHSTGMGESQSRSTANRHTGTSQQSTQQFGSGTTTSSNQNYSNSHSSGESETYVTNHIERKDHSQQFWPLTEQQYQLRSLLRNQPDRYAFVQIGREHEPFQMFTLDVSTPSISPTKLVEFKQLVSWSHSCYLPAEVAWQRISHLERGQYLMIEPTAPSRRLLLSVTPQDDPDNPFE